MSVRTAFVSGAARGIGRAIALRLAEQGHAVAVADLLEPEAEETAQLIEAAGGQARALPLDITEPDSVSRAARAAGAALGPIDILVNNAGWDELKPFLETDERFWDRVIDVNFKGCLRLTRELLPGMVERRFGRIVNIGSDAGGVGSSMEAVYAGAKSS